MAANPYDKAARYVAKLDPQGLFAWLLADIWQLVEFVGWLDTRMLAFPGEPDRICDTVGHLRERSPPQGRPPISWASPLEFQSELDAEMHERLVEYSIRCRRELRPSNGLRRYEVAALLVNLSGGPQADQWKSGLPEPSRIGLTSTIGVRTMAEEDAQALLAAIEAGQFSRCLLPWIPLMRGADRPEILATWKRLAAAEPDSRLRSDYAALALVFSELAGRHSLWKEALKGWNMKQSKQVLEWQEEARRDALLEGEARGEARGEVVAIELGLELKFGEDGLALMPQVRSIQELELLRRLRETVRTAQTLDQVRAVLEELQNGRD